MLMQIAKQEACAVGLQSELTANDSVMTAYRCHAWAYLLGITPLGVIAELMGLWGSGAGWQ